MTENIYLDYAATTPVDPRVAAAMCQYMTHEHHFGNPTSTHVFGKTAKIAVDHARQQVANLIQSDPDEIIFTSGATEANNLALKGIAQLYQNKGKHIITLKTEHPSILDTCQFLEKQGYFVTYLSPDTNGLLDLKKFKAALQSDTILVSIMHINNETGVIQNIQSIAETTTAAGVLFHTDAAQSAGKIILNVKDIPVDLVSLSAHKIYGPKGIGALFVRRKPRVRVAPLIHGGGQEQGMRSGTLPTHQIVGMGAAFELAKTNMDTEYKKINKLRDRFLQGMSNNNIQVNSDINNAYPGILNIRFAKNKAEDILKALPQLAISTGSACLSKGMQSSSVLRAMRLSDENIRESLRFSFGRFTTETEIDFAITKLQNILS